MQRTLRREILAGLSTFFTMAYLLFLYPQILSAGGVDFGSALSATILTLVISTLFLALYADFPAVLAPGLSVGPFLIYSVVLKQGVSWQLALGLVFWSGIALLILSLLKVRQKILLHLPDSMKVATVSGIGLFLICIGLKDLGIWDPQLMRFSGALWTLSNGIALFGLLLFYLAYRKKINSAFLISILSCWMLSLIFGLSEWNGFIGWPPSLGATFLQLDLKGALSPHLLGTLFTITLISLIDTSASLTILSRLMGSVTEKGLIRNIDRIVIPDGAGSSLGALLGTGTLTFLLESSSGIKAGGRTKITAITAAFCSLICLLLYPLISSIPLFATAPALIALGVFMALDFKRIPWKDWTEWVPAFITLITIPLSFSIYQGFTLGFLSYVAIKAILGRFKEVHPVCWILSAIFTLHLVSSLFF